MDWLRDFIQAEGLPDSLEADLNRAYRPLAERIAETYLKLQATTIVGICGPQGSGKSTTVALLARLLNDDGFKTATVSLDDFYLTREAREALAIDVHPLLRTRGVPSTHDVPLGIETLHRLSQADVTAIPQFDKAKDTRKASEQWPIFIGKADIVLFEGWCVGAKPQSEAALSVPVNDLERTRDPDGLWRRVVNTALAGPYQALFQMIDFLVLMRAPSFETVLGWRQEQERKLRQRLERDGIDSSFTMTDNAIAVFIQHYERLTRHIDREMSNRADIVLRLDRDRHWAMEVL